MKNKTDLTPRQVEIVDLFARDKSYKEIANQLRISEETVRSHLTNVRYKLNVRSTRGAVAFAVLKGIITLQTS